MFEPRFPLARLRPAPYNPRRIDPAEQAALERSLREIGIVKPLIAAGDTLVAGHQRLRALLRLGMQTAPVWCIDALDPFDEVRFNQLHNGTDMDSGEDVRVPPGEPTGEFVDVPAKRVELRGSPPGAPLRANIASLILRYGPWGAAVATPDGHIISGAAYAWASTAVGEPLRVFRGADGDAVRHWLGQRYGRFCYDGVPRTPGAQTWAQMHRLRGQRRDLRSSLYEKLVLPALNPDWRLLDFGFGQGDYLALLRRRDVSAYGFEPWPRSGGELDIERARSEAERTLESLERDGPFDAVVCDSVLNSVDSLQAEADVLDCLVALCKPGGTIFLSGRRAERIASVLRHRKARDPDMRYVEFLDDDGFSAIYRRGLWTFQKFHTFDEAQTLAVEKLGPVQAALHGSTSWQIACIAEQKVDPAAAEAALRREFDLPWPDGRSLGLADSATAAWRRAALKQQLRD